MKKLAPLFAMATICLSTTAFTMTTNPDDVLQTVPGVSDKIAADPSHQAAAYHTVTRKASANHSYKHHTKTHNHAKTKTKSKSKTKKTSHHHKKS